MTDRIDCPNCGERVARPAGFTRKKIRCPACGYYAETPADWQADAPESAEPATDGDKPERVRRAKPAGPVARRRLDPRDFRPDFTDESGTGKPLLVGDDDEESDAPYTVPGSGTFPCPECRDTLPLGATLCVHCGYNFTTRKRKKRRREEIDREFDEGPSYHHRLGVFAGLQVFNSLFTLLLYVQLGSPNGTSDILTLFISQVVNTGLQAFLIGSFSTVRVERTRTGEGFLTRQNRVAFLTTNRQEVDWHEGTTVGVLATHSAGLFTYAMCLYLLAMGCLPGLVFYWFVIRPDRHNVVVVDVYGATLETVYRGLSHETATEVATCVGEATGLKFRHVI